ncbi:hypothetical protein Ct9H90mP29_20610 [bacterium]|nr:MAG: hypothetical protein Ct9H90mP29_20610 [bacterium]
MTYEKLLRPGFIGLIEISMIIQPNGYEFKCWSPP